MIHSQKMLALAGWLWPLFALPLFFWLILADVLSFGGGEKDVIMILPATFYALLYWIAFLIWRRKKILAGWAILYALGSAVAAMVLIGVAFSAYLGLHAR